MWENDAPALVTNILKCVRTVEPLPGGRYYESSSSIFNNSLSLMLVQQNNKLVSFPKKINLISYVKIKFPTES